MTVIDCANNRDRITDARNRSHDWHDFVIVEGGLRSSQPTDCGPFGAAGSAKTMFFREPRDLIDRRSVEFAIRGATQGVNSWLLICAAAIPVLAIGSWVAADAVQPVGYSPLRQSVSVLAGHGGTDRWIVTAGLIGAGVCYLILAQVLTIADMTARLGLFVAGLSAIGIAACPEPVHGSTPQHLAFTALGGVTIAIWPAVMARSTATKLLSPRTSLIASAVCSGLAIWTFVETQTDDALGLAERLSSSTAICWPFVVVLALWVGTERRPVAERAIRGDRTADQPYASLHSCRSPG